jgi:CheY-like chemotaxis protein
MRGDHTPTVLVVDDKADARALVFLLLRRARFDVTEAPDRN